MTKLKEQFYIGQVINESRICFISSSEEFIPAFYISLDYSWYERYGIFVPTPDLD